MSDGTAGFGTTSRVMHVFKERHDKVVTEEPLEESQAEKAYLRNEVKVLEHCHPVSILMSSLNQADNNDLHGDYG